MKRKLALSLLLVTGLSACSVNLPQGVTPGASQQGAVSAATIEAKADIFDVMLLNKANGGNAPITPEQISSLKIDGQAIATNSILLPGSATAESFSQAKLRQDEAAKAAQGKPVAIFGGNGAYTFIVPRTDKNSVLEVQLKGQSQTYKLVRFANLSRGTFLFSSNGQVEGAFNTRGAFQTKADGNGVLGSLESIFSNPGGYYALAQFAIHGFAHFYQAADASIKVTTQDNHQLTFTPANTSQPASDTQVSDQQEAQAKAEVTQQVGENLSPLLGYIGSWTLESDLLKALVPGGELLVNVAQAGSDTYTLSATVSGNTYSGTSKVSGGGDTSTLNLEASSNGKTIGVQVRMVTNNRVSVKLTQAQGVAQLSGMVGTEVFLKRAL